MHNIELLLKSNFSSNPNSKNTSDFFFELLKLKNIDRDIDSFKIDFNKNTKILNISFIYIEQRMLEKISFFNIFKYL